MKSDFGQCRDGCVPSVLSGCGEKQEPACVIGWDLQLFAEEKTEEATPRKRRKEREEGRVAKSQDLNAGVVVLVGLAALFAFSRQIWEAYAGLLRWCAVTCEGIAGERGDWVTPLTRQGFSGFLHAWLPYAAVCLVAAFSVVALQVGFKISPKALEPKADRFNVISGISRMFSLRSFVEMLKALLKAAILFVVLYTCVRGDIQTLSGMSGYSAHLGTAKVLKTVFSLGMRMAAVLFLLGLFDYIYQKWEFERKIKMTKQEVKDEYKQMEGDPMVRSRIRQKQREMTRNRMIGAVPDADVVVNNPTHLSLALKYDRDEMNAPVVIAKGAGYLALKIREIAEAHDVPQVEDKPLARALYPRVEPGDEIPEDFFRAVAEVLAYVYALKEKDKSPGGSGKRDPSEEGWKF